MNLLEFCRQPFGHFSASSVHHAQKWSQNWLTANSRLYQLDGKNNALALMISLNPAIEVIEIAVQQKETQAWSFFKLLDLDSGAGLVRV